MCVCVCVCVCMCDFRQPTTTKVWEQAKAHADEIHQTLTAHPARAEAVPDWNSQWDYSTPGGILPKDQFTAYLLAGLELVNYERL